MRFTARTAFELLIPMLLCGAVLFFISRESSNAPVETQLTSDRSEKDESLSQKEKRALSLSRAARQRRARFSEPTLTKHSPEKASAGLTLISPEGTAEARLVDMNGVIRHRWSADVMRARLLPNCNLLVIHGSKWGVAHKPWGQLSQYIREFDWDGNLVWEYQPEMKPHHDAHRLANGNTLFLRFNRVPSQIRAKNRDPIKRNGIMRSDTILEVTPGGKIAWSWNFYDHFEINSCGRASCPPLHPSVLGERTRYKFDWSHVNTSSPIPENRHFDDGDERFRPGNILLLPRNWSAAYLIDRHTGEPVWHYFGEAENGLRGGHEVHMIPKGLPGAGNILVFNNGSRVGDTQPGSSRIQEIDPLTKEVIWSYSDGERFFSHAAGSVQRLANGNTLISEDVAGRTFEVTRSGEIVWEYEAGSRINRSQRYGYDYCPRLLKLSQVSTSKAALN